MASKITFFPVGNGDMTLVKLSSGRTLLIDVNIRSSADDDAEPERDVATDLRERLEVDEGGRHYVDAFLLTHPDEDHCRGLETHFHLGPPDDHEGDRIFVREIWSSPMVFRRANQANHKLCSDAKAFNKEAKRRVQRFRDDGLNVAEGDRILILGKDRDGKTDDLMDIVVEIDDFIRKINRESDASFEACLLGPLPFCEDEDEEEELSKNDSSVILQIRISEGGETTKFLTGGDAGVGIWKRMWDRHSGDTSVLEYDLLQAPHHCSWRTLSYDSWSENQEEAEVCEEARKALGQALSGAYIVSSSNPIKDDDNDPPCVRAKREYESILRSVSGSFECTGSYPKESAPEPLEFKIGSSGLQLRAVGLGGAASLSKRTSKGEPLGHG